MQNLVKFHQFVLKIFSRNEILTIIKRYNSVINLQKWIGNNPGLDLVKSMHMQTLIKFHLFAHKILSGNEILTITKGHNSVVNLRKWTGSCNNPSLNVVKVNAYAKFDQIPSIRTQDIERKQNPHDNQGPLLCFKFAKMGA